MRLLHTADWHLGKRLENYSRHSEQCEVLDEICEIADRFEINAVIIAGDLFDTFNPPTESTELFYKTLKRLSANGQRAVIAIAGNHDSPDRIEAPDPLARECGIIFAGYPNSVVPPFSLDSGLRLLHSEEGFISLKLPGEEPPLRILLTPYANQFRLMQYLGNENPEEELRHVLQERWRKLSEKYCDTAGVNILLTHLFMMTKGEDIPAEPEDEKPILHVGGAQAIYTENIPAQIQYTALGHLHRHQTIGGISNAAAYSGSPLSYSFAEADQQKYVLMIDLQPGKEAKMERVLLNKGKKLLRKRCESVPEALEWLRVNSDALVELTMATDTYLSAQERKSLLAVHEGIVSLIPDVKNNIAMTGGGRSQIDLSQSMEKLFAEYFRHTKAQEPDEQLMDLFREVLSEEEEA